tara:strand:- start:10142 stop:10360 length:219 start_codon:yes stop_codon:yes gene_type:complete
MKAMNNFVIVEQEVQSHGSIIMKENNVGKVVSCSIDKELVGKTIIFSTAKAIQEYDEYKFVPYEFVMAVLEE